MSHKMEDLMGQVAMLSWLVAFVSLVVGGMLRIAPQFFLPLMLSALALFTFLMFAMVVGNLVSTIKRKT